MNAEIPELEPDLGFERKPGPLGTFLLGVSVWSREMGRILLGQAKRHEIRQLETRLREEYAQLGRLGGTEGGAGGGAASPERELCLKQIDMLKAELALLRREKAATEPRAGARPAAD